MVRFHLHEEMLNISHGFTVMVLFLHKGFKGNDRENMCGFIP